MRKLPFIAFAFILFSFLTRSLQIIYIDLYGPFDSLELGRPIGVRNYGFGLFLLSYLPFFFALGSIRFRHNLISLNKFDWFCVRIFDIISSLLIVFCFIELLLFREIPIFHNIDRLQFNETTEGTIHSVLRNISPLLTVGLGVSLYQKKLSLLRYDVQSTFNLILLLIYFVLTGNRFSIFYTMMTFFLFSRSFYPNQRVEKSTNIIAVVRNSKFVFTLFIGLAVFAVARNIYYSFTLIRGYEDAALAFFNRAILENVGVYQAIYDNGPHETKITEYFLFEVLDNTKSSSMQFLMHELSYSYNYINQIVDGQVFSGGFPEFFIYTLNYYFLFLIIPISYIMKGFVALMTKTVIRKNILLFLLGFQCVFPFFLFFTSGFIDFLFNPIFYLKVVTFILIYHVYRFYNNSSVQC